MFFPWNPMADEKKKPLQLQLPKAQYEYLTYLAKHSFLGTRETEVAAFILTEALKKMISERFHETQFPRDSGESEPS